MSVHWSKLRALQGRSQVLSIKAVVGKLLLPELDVVRRIHHDAMLRLEHEMLRCLKADPDGEILLATDKKKLSDGSVHECARVLPGGWDEQRAAACAALEFLQC